jgi:hypothetical protein
MFDRLLEIRLILELSQIRPDNIYGESLHVRGVNISYLENTLEEKLELAGFDSEAEGMFNEALDRYGMMGIWWPDHAGK